MQRILPKKGQGALRTALSHTRRGIPRPESRATFLARLLQVTGAAISQSPEGYSEPPTTKQRQAGAETAAEAKRPETWTCTCLSEQLVPRCSHGWSVVCRPLRYADSLVDSLRALIRMRCVAAALGQSDGTM